MKQPKKNLRVVPAVVGRISDLFIPDFISRLRDKREWFRWIDSLDKETLDDLTDAPLEAKQRVFKANVTRVEIETHAKCNRICSFCPNSIIDRRLSATLADRGLLVRVFRDLGSIDYSAQIMVARYSEPLANREYLYEQLRLARGLVPNAQLAITTNTDYLKPRVLDELRDASLNWVYMSLYLRDHERWSVELAREYSRRLVEKLNLRIIRTHETRLKVQGWYEYKDLRLFSSCTNFERTGSDRGGVMSQYSERRRGPCRDPFQTFVVDYNGSVVPCCNVRSDLPQHHNCVAGDLSVPGTSIFDIYAGQLSGWRRSMVSFGKKEFPCATCQHRDITSDLVGPVSARLKQRLYQIERAELFKQPAAGD